MRFAIRRLTGGLVPMAAKGAAHAVKAEPARLLSARTRRERERAAERRSVLQHVVHDLPAMRRDSQIVAAILKRLCRRLPCRQSRSLFSLTFR